MINDILRIQVECGFFGGIVEWVSGASFAGGGCDGDGWEDDDLYAHPTPIAKRRLENIICGHDVSMDRWKRSHWRTEDDIVRSKRFATFTCTGGQTGMHPCGN